MRGTSRNSIEGPVPAGTPADRRRSEAGDTLVEVLLAIVVLGLTSVALLTAFGTIISSSAEYRGLATMDTVLRSASQQAISQVGQQSGALFASCESAGPSGPGQVNFSLPVGYTAVVSSVQYWNASATPPVFNPPSTWLSTSFSPCIPNAPQLLTITVTAASSGTSSSIRSVVDQQSRPVAGEGVATQLVFITEPGNGTTGTNLSPEPAVAVEDAEGNIVYSDLSDVQLTINGGPSGGSLSNTCTGSEFYGVVTFSDCSVNSAGTGYTISATDKGLQSALSSTFNVTAGSAP
jgi:type II secretory pathway pseudopilin PulG